MSVQGEKLISTHLDTGAHHRLLMDIKWKIDKIN